MNETISREPELAARLRRAQADVIAAPRPFGTPVRRAVRHRSARRSVGGFAVVWCALVALSYVGSTLMGQTMLEQARREGLRAQERSREASMDAAVLRDRLRRLTSMRAVDEWATVRGYKPQEQAVVVLGGPLRVARR